MLIQQQYHFPWNETGDYIIFPVSLPHNDIEFLNSRKGDVHNMEGGDCGLPCSAVRCCVLQKLCTLPLHRFYRFRPAQNLVWFQRWTGG